MSRTRAGRRAYETRINFSRDVANFAAALATKKWKYSAAETAAIKVERAESLTGNSQTISFDQAYADLSLWLGKSFSNSSDLGLTDMLAETLLSGATIVTMKAEYRISKNSS